MTQAEFLNHYAWLIAILLTTGVVSWAVLLLKALFYDKRIALIGVFGSLLVAFLAVSPELVPFADIAKMVAAAVCLLFFLWFVLANIKQPAVFLPAIALILTLLVSYRLYQAYQLAV